MTPRYLRNTWYVAMWSTDLDGTALRDRMILNQPLVFFRKEDGTVAALTDRCPHRFAPLHIGTRQPGDQVRCGYHGLEFDADGRRLRNPHGNGNIPPAAAVAGYPVVEKHGLVWIWMGDRTPEPSKIPDFSFLDAAPAEHVSRRDWLRLDASYELITDNLLDLSHVSFLHHGILGNDETIAAQTAIEQHGDPLEVTRVMRDVPPDLFDMMFRRDGERVDLLNAIRWDPPGCMRNDAGVCPPGEPRENGSGIFGTHVLTPETDTTTHYHFAAVRQNQQNARAIDDGAAAEVQQRLSDLRRIAFAEQDAPMIAAQQRALLQAGAQTERPTLLSIDVGPVRYKKILDALIDAEGEGVA